ncbi:hypothetical protein GALL_531200 [mine drainage metagenome]|uniref:Uncharacterized protein n=1 Tax=mine drainage metagenome TaxID=410659 RepID=A0A1J5PJ74_9ZZZZ
MLPRRQVHIRQTNLHLAADFGVINVRQFVVVRFGIFKSNRDIGKSYIFTGLLEHLDFLKGAQVIVFKLFQR